MTTLDDCLLKQQLDSILVAPTDASSTPSSSSTATTTSLYGTNYKAAAAAASSSSASSSSFPSTVQIVLKNTTDSTLYAAVTGLAINNDNAVFLLQSDGSTAYYPANPSANQQALSANCTILVGSPGSSRTITVPQLAGARIWLSQDVPLTFLLNQGTSGPGLIEPSVTNTSDANYAIRWDFCEFTFNTSVLFANLSYVDFVSIPVALQLESSDGSATQTVEGLSADGLDTVCLALQEQQRKDCAGWDRLVVQISSAAAGTRFLRALSPNCGIVLTPGLFDNYYEPYVEAVWQKYQTSSLTVNTQVSSWGDVVGSVGSDGQSLTFTGIGSFAKPSTSDIFSCSTGAFATYATNTEEMGNLTARLAAALNRSTLLSDSEQPEGEAKDASTYYVSSPTNHYARIVHATNLDGRGYAFPYDDVAPTDGDDQSGSVASSAPQTLTVTVGGGAYSSTASTTRSMHYTAGGGGIFLREKERSGRLLVADHRRVRRGLEMPAEAREATAFVDEKHQLAARYAEDERQQQQAPINAEKLDLEKGLGSDISGPGQRATPAVRLSLLIHQLLLHVWALLRLLARRAWATVPQRVAVPLGAAAATVAASPAMAAVVASTSSTISTLVSVAAAVCVRPFILRTVLLAALMLACVVSGGLPTAKTLANPSAETTPRPVLLLTSSIMDSMSIKSQ